MGGVERGQRRPRPSGRAADPSAGTGTGCAEPQRKKLWRIFQLNFENSPIITIEVTNRNRTCL
jgi:hypothetical protein